MSKDNNICAGWFRGDENTDAASSEWHMCRVFMFYII